MRRLLAALLVALLLWPSLVSAATYYVDASATGANNGLTEADAWTDLATATSTAVAGDLVYVKNGTYNHATATSTTVPAFNPVNSGSAAAGHITFQAFPGHTPVVSRTNQAADNDNAPVIGANGRSYIKWVGFHVATGVDIGIWTSDYVVIDRCIVGKGIVVHVTPAGERNNIRVEGSSNVEITNSTISTNGWSNGALYNASGVHVRDVQNITIANNEFFDVDTAIFFKKNTDNAEVYKNYIRQTIGEAIRVAAYDADDIQTNIRIYQNIVYDVVDTGIMVDWSSSSVPGSSTGIEVYNNTLWDIDRIGIAQRNVSLATFKFYNNAINIAGPTTPNYDLSFADGNPTNVLSNYHRLHRSTGSVSINVGGTGESLATWQARTPVANHDDQSTTGDAELEVTPTGTAPPSTNFRPDADSPLRNTGRTGGTSGGSVVNIGAFLSDSDVIGINPTGGGTAVLLPVTHRPAVTERPSVTSRPGVTIRPGL